MPGEDEVMLGCQSTIFHDALYVRDVFDLKRAPEFEAWLTSMNVTDHAGRLLPNKADHKLLAQAV